MNRREALASLFLVPCAMQSVVAEAAGWRSRVAMLLHGRYRLMPIEEFGTATIANLVVEMEALTAGLGKSVKSAKQGEQ